LTSIGQNPTGGTLSTPRRKEIYALCSKYDIIIIEDDPYWYLQYPSAALLEARSRNAPLPKSVLAGISGKSSGYAFLDSLQPSYLSIDFEGRVVRLDTFSKTVAPGCRLGWITAQPKIIERMLRITETSTQQPSGFVQAMMAELIIGPQTASNAYAKKSKADQLSFSGWKADGWVRWLEGLRGMYERRMNRMATILDSGRILLKQQTPIKAAESDWAVISKTEMYSFFWPHGGMFVWLKLHLENHNLFSKVGGPKLSRTLWNYLASESQVLVAPGSLFSPTVEIADAEGWKYLRLCFAAVTEEEIDESSKKFTSGMNSFWAIKDEKDLPPDDEAMAGNMEVSESELVNLAF
jgi:DNA-binding transcriptional MocR family regulator